MHFLDERISSRTHFSSNKIYKIIVILRALDSVNHFVVVKLDLYGNTRVLNTLIVTSEFACRTLTNMVKSPLNKRVSKRHQNKTSFPVRIVSTFTLHNFNYHFMYYFNKIIETIWSISCFSIYTSWHLTLSCTVWICLFFALN